MTQEQFKYVHDDILMIAQRNQDCHVNIDFIGDGEIGISATLNHPKFKLFHKDYNMVIAYNGLTRKSAYLMVDSIKSVIVRLQNK